MYYNFSEMEWKVQRPVYYFSSIDEEILDLKLLKIEGDDDTWLYRVDSSNFNGHIRTQTQPYQYHSPSGSLDSRTYTRRKHSMRPLLESVVESPRFNRSSLGILSTTQLNGTRLVDHSETKISTSQGKTSSSFTVSDEAPVPRVFKLDTPLMNNPFDRKRHDSELSDSFIIPSLNSQFDKNEEMTDSLVNFLEKPTAKCQPPVSFQDENPKTESEVSLSDDGRGIELIEEVMTASIVNFLDPVSCKPPSGFADEEMTDSIVNIDEEVLPGSDLTNSLVNYLDYGNGVITSLTQSTTSEAENVPPERFNGREEESKNFYQTDRSGSVNSNLLTDDIQEYPEITLTNNVNISRTIEIDTDGGLNTTFVNEIESDHKMRALINKDLNVTLDLPYDSHLDTFTISRVDNKSLLNQTFTRSANDNKSQINQTFTKSASDNSTRLDGTFTKDRNGPFMKNNLNRTVRQIPQRNSTFNTTFTKLDPPSDLSRNLVTRSTECLDTGIEDDRTSSASDSSFSSAASSNKRMSVDELRNIAQQQETNLQKSSTPVEKEGRVPMIFPDSENLSPILSYNHRLGETRRVMETRIAHRSPVRSSIPNLPQPHPVSRLQHPEMRRQALQASSLSNLRTSGLRIRPSTAPTPTPAPAPTGIPRPQASRLPMPRSRASGIPKTRRGGRI